MEKIKLSNDILIDNYEEVDNYDLERIVPNSGAEKLNGLIVRAYEMKFGQTANENGEVYSDGAFSDFIKRYFVDKKFNIPVTLMHGRRFEDLVGRVLCCEINSVGLYFVCYVPRTALRYEQVKSALQEGLLQGLSKEGWATDYDWKEDGTMVVNQFDLLCVSLVDLPANGVNFEKLQEIKNATHFVDKRTKTNIEDNIDDMFN